MTKCERTYALPSPLDDTLLQAISELHGVYGIQKLKASPDLHSLTVGWDASRLSLAQVESILSSRGFAITK